ncbi:hypothetical protein F7725_023570 [Dissostichus mawsoni]|uniref:Uncharacterized protein n=1 Tax=Dissostichus mawsoni TaxID=36200 RepID=A0A7J5XYJ0_DISMA|nr:hypothetical protein F7725_023570 [Dissostichus mawsoni]
MSGLIMLTHDFAAVKSSCSGWGGAGVELGWMLGGAGVDAGVEAGVEAGMELGWSWGGSWDGAGWKLG